MLIHPEGAAPEPEVPTQKPPATRLHRPRKRRTSSAWSYAEARPRHRTAEKHDEAKHEVTPPTLNRPPAPEPPIRKETFRTWSYAWQRPRAEPLLKQSSRKGPAQGPRRKKPDPKIRLRPAHPPTPTDQPAGGRSSGQGNPPSRTRQAARAPHAMTAERKRPGHTGRRTASTSSAAVCTARAGTHSSEDEEEAEEEEESKAEGGGGSTLMGTAPTLVIPADE